jgi:hypothetical protein
MDRIDSREEDAVSRGAASATLTFLLLLSYSPANLDAQSLLGQLSTLLTEQRASGPFVPDPAAAAATRDTVAGLFLVDLNSLPTASSSGGFGYRFRPDLGLFERASDAFGAFFTERALSNGHGQTSVGLTFQYASFGSLQGASLSSGTFPSNAARFTNAVDPFSVDTLRLELDSRTVTPFINYGVTDALTVGASVPIVTVRFSGTRVRTTDGVATLQSSESGSATGLGDIVIDGRYRLAGTGNRGFAVGGDLRLPTGDQANLQGTDEVAGRMLAIGSWEDGQLAVHLNGGVGLGGVSREVFWSTATTFAVAPRVTLVGELMGRWLSELTHVNAVYQPHPVLAGVETMRWLPSDRGVHTLFVVTGAKWNVGGSWLLNTNLLIRVTNAGLRAIVTPAVSLDYSFKR